MPVISDINDSVLKKVDSSLKEKPKDAQAVKATVGSTPVSSASFYGQKTTTPASSNNVQSNTNTQTGSPNKNSQSSQNSQIGRVNKNYQSNSNSQTNMPPPSPKRDEGTGTGSTYTVYAPPGSTFADSTGGPYREPELVTEDENMPGLTPAYDNGAGVDKGTAWGSGWASGSGSGSRWPNDDYIAWQNSYSDWDRPNYGSNTQLGPVSWVHHNDGTENDPAISGREENEERNWWFPEYVVFRPGRGMLAPLLVDLLHNPDHTLVSVSVTPPDLKPVVASSSDTATAAGQRVSYSSPPSSPKEKTTHSRSASASPHIPPTAEEIREAIPHPQAYYCRRHNGWVILSWEQSNENAELISSRKQGVYVISPVRRTFSHSGNCLGDKANKTHHFHRYTDKIDAWVLKHPYRPRSFEKAERAKQARRRMTVGSDDLSSDILERAMANELESQLKAEAVAEAKEEEESAIRLDMYLCCQCLFSVACSEVIPGVIPSRDVEEFNTEKSQNPPLGKSPERSVHQAWETVLTCVYILNLNSTKLNKTIGSSRISYGKAMTSLCPLLARRFPRRLVGARLRMRDYIDSANI